MCITISDEAKAVLKARAKELGISVSGYIELIASVDETKEQLKRQLKIHNELTRARVIQSLMGAEEEVKKEATLMESNPSDEEKTVKAMEKLAEQKDAEEAKQKASEELIDKVLEENPVNEIPVVPEPPKEPVKAPKGKSGRSKLNITV